MKCAVYTGSRNIYEDMVIAAKSLIAYSDVDKIYFLIEDDNFPFDIPKTIEIRNVSNQTYFKPNGPNMTTHFTYFAMMRAALAFEFPELDILLSLDCDTFCRRDVSKIWELPIKDYYFAASQEPARSVNGLLYTNVGVNLMNLKNLRESGKAEECVDILNRRNYTFVDQDVMNYLCQGYIYDMHSEYNATEYTLPCQNPRIIHYAGQNRTIWRKTEQARKWINASWNEVLDIRKQNGLYPE